MKKYIYLLLFSFIIISHPISVIAQEDEDCPDPSEDCDVDNGGGNGNGDFDGDCWVCSDWIPGGGLGFGSEITCRPGVNICIETGCVGGSCN